MKAMVSAVARLALAASFCSNVVIRPWNATMVTGGVVKVAAFAVIWS